MSSLFSHLRRGFGENVRFALLAVRAHKLRAGADGARHRRRRRDRHRDGLDRDRLQQQHGPQLPELRRDARAVPEVRGAVRPGPPRRRRAQPQGPDARGRAGAEGARSPRCAPSRRSGTSGTPTSTSSTATTETTTPDGRRRRPRTTRSRTTTSSDYGRFITESDIEHASPVAVIGEDVREGALPARGPAQQDRRAERLEVHRHRRLREEGRLRRGLEQQLRSSSRSRPSTTSSRSIKNEPRRHDPHRDRPVPAGAGPTRHREGPGAPARAPARAVQQAEDDFAIFTPDKMIESFQGITRGITRRDDLHRVHLAPDRRRRRDEHHARLGHGADARDRRAQGRRAPSAATSSCSS